MSFHDRSCNEVNRICTNKCLQGVTFKKNIPVLLDWNADRKDIPTCSCPFGHLSIVSPGAQWMLSILDSHRLEKWCYTLNPVTKRSLGKKTLCEEVHLIIPLFIIIPAASSLYSLKNWKVTRGVYFRGFILHTNWDPTSYKSDISFVRSENTGGHSDPKWML